MEKIIVGLTGLSGSGKSTAAKFFRDKGACVIDCDALAHRALCSDSVKEELKREFGSSIFDENGEISRKALGAIVFSDSEKLKKLNGIVHPVVCSDALEIIAASGARLSVIDGSELEASGIDEKCRHIIVISARRDIRLSRIIKRDSIPAGNAQRRIDAQHPYSKKAIIVENNGGTEELYSRLSLIYNEIMGENNA